jgi:hypothetical protein
MTEDRVSAAGNRPALIALIVGVLSLPAALTYVGGMVLGFAAVIAGFVGVARSRHLEGAGEGFAVAGVILGMFGMALPVAVSLFLAA